MTAAFFFMNAGGKILVIRGGAIGDFILTLPVLSALREVFPQAWLEVLGYPHIAGLAVLGKLADDVRSIEAQSLAGFFATNGELDDGLAAYFASFHIILSYLFDPDQIFQANVLRCSKAQFIQGPHRPNESEAVHATDVFLKPLERLAIFAADPTPRLAVAAQPSLPQCIAVHPGSGSEKKNWAEAKWEELLPRLADAFGHRFMIVGGEAEGNKLQRIARSLPAERVELLQSLPLPELAQRLAECSFFIGHDSGITHLAGAVGLEGLVLWGETNASVWRPRSDRMMILRAENGLNQMSVDEVYEAIRPAMSKQR